MECHKCEHRAAVAAGRYHNVPYDRTPCSQCELNESSIGTIAYRDELPAAVDCGTAGAPVVSISAEELQQWLRGLLTLPRGSWDIVTMRLQGREWPDIVRRLGVKERTARQRLCRVLRSVPALAVMYRAEVIKRSRRHDNRSKKGR